MSSTNAVIDEFVHEEDEAQKDFENEHRLAQAALRLKRITVPEGKMKRYQQTSDSSGGPTHYDVVWVDRLTGTVVFRYDGADPANTNSYYGAMGDDEMFAKRGLDPYELIDEAAAKPMPVYHEYYNGLDEFDDDDWYGDSEPDEPDYTGLDDDDEISVAQREAEAEDRKRADENRAWREVRDGDHWRPKPRIEFKRGKTKKQRKLLARKASS